MERLKRIEWLKQQKLSLEEIKEHLSQWGKIPTKDGAVTERITALQLQLIQLEKEAKEIAPLIDRMKPNKARSLIKSLSPQTAASIEALLLLLSKGPLL